MSTFGPSFELLEVKGRADETDPPITVFGENFAVGHPCVSNGTGPFELACHIGEIGAPLCQVILNIDRSRLTITVFTWVVLESGSSVHNSSLYATVSKLYNNWSWHFSLFLVGYG